MRKVVKTTIVGMASKKMIERLNKLRLKELITEIKNRKS